MHPTHISRLRLAWIAALSGVLATTPVARAAHPLVDTGVQQASEAEFEAALTSFSDAWNSVDLSREDLVVLLAQRATVNFALREAAAVDRDLALLVVLDRQYQFGRHVPPPMKEQLEQVRRGTAAPQINVALSFAAERANVEVEIQGIPKALQREVRVTAREVGGVWISSPHARVTISSLSAAAIEWFVEVVGPGGSIILREGDMSTPRRTARPLAWKSAPPLPSDTVQAEPRHTGTWHWWALGGGAALAAVATTLALTMTRDPATTSQVSGPVLLR